MAINVERQTLSLNKVISRNTQVAWVEQDILVPDTKPDVMKIVQVEAIPFLRNTEVVDSGIRVTGEITYYIIYRAMDKDATNGISMTYPFSQIINVPGAKKGMSARVMADAKNIIYSLPNERKVSLKTEMVLKYTITQSDDVQLIGQINEEEDIESKNSTDVFYNVISAKEEIIDVKEDIVFPESIPSLGEILRVSSNISNTDYKVSYNKILVKGDINLEMVYIESGDEKGVYTYNTSVPFTGMIEFENIAENYRFDIKYSLANLEFIQGENNIVNVVAEVITEAVMFEEKEVTYVNDFYSTKSNLNYDKKEVAVVKNKESIEKQITVKDKIGITDNNNKIISYTIGTNHLNTKISGGTLYIDGPLKVNVTFEHKDKKTIDSKTYDLLLDTSIPLNKEVSEENVDVNLTVENKIVTVQNGNVDASVTLKIIADIENVDKVIIVSDIEQEKENSQEFDSMYMYIVKKGDTLWDIAKKYKTTVDKIANINNILDENKIDIGQKILIIR